MALSAEQKEINKAARKVRDQAFLARNREYRERIAGMEAAVKSSDEARRVQESSDQREALLAERNEKLEQIQKKIAELQEESARITREYNGRFDEMKTGRNVAWAAKEALEKRLRAEVDAVFPDMAGMWISAAAWAPPEDILAGNPELATAMKTLSGDRAKESK